MDGTDDFAPKRPFLFSHGLKFPKHPQFIRGPVRGALRENRYELKETQAALRIVRRDDVVLELGGGLGYMSTLVAARCKVREVHVFEANPQLIEYMTSVHAANGIENATIHHALLAEKAGDPVPFYVRENFLASSLDKDAMGGVIAQEQVEVRGVQDTLDQIKPSVLICDIEGAEAHVLPAGDFQGLRAAIIETHPQWIGQKGVQAVFDTMQAAGLTYFPKASDGKVVTFLKDW